MAHFARSCKGTEQLLLFLTTIRGISMEKEIERRSIINVLRNMDVGAIEVFPIIQKTSVTYTLNARLYKEKAEGMVWKTKSDVKNMQFIVTRIA